MTKQEKPEFDYLQSLVSEQIQEVRNIGPIGYEIIVALKPPTNSLEIELLIHKMMEMDNLILRVEADGLNLRTQPGISYPAIKVLPRGSQLIALDREVERNLGVQGQWLYVQDMAGDRGYIVADFVSKLETSRDPNEKIDQTMRVLEHFSKMDLVHIDKFGTKFTIGLTQKGKYLSDFLVNQDEGRFNNEQFFK